MREVFGLFCMLVLLRGLVSEHLTDASMSAPWPLVELRGSGQGKYVGGLTCDWWAAVNYHFHFYPRMHTTFITDNFSKHGGNLFNPLHSNVGHSFSGVAQGSDMPKKAFGQTPGGEFEYEYVFDEFARSDALTHAAWPAYERASLTSSGEFVRERSHALRRSISTLPCVRACLLGSARMPCSM